MEYNKDKRLRLALVTFIRGVKTSRGVVTNKECFDCAAYFEFSVNVVRKYSNMNIGALDKEISKLCRVMEQESYTNKIHTNFKSQLSEDDKNVIIKVLSIADERARKGIRVSSLDIEKELGGVITYQTILKIINQRGRYKDSYKIYNASVGGADLKTLNKYCDRLSIELAQEIHDVAKELKSDNIAFTKKILDKYNISRATLVNIRGKKGRFKILIG